MLTIDADLLAAQLAASIKPAIQCVFTSANPPAGQNATYDYSFDPTVATNRLYRIEHDEEPYDGGASILLKNNDRVVPDLTGYYVDIGYGANTISGLKYATRPRLWVHDQKNVSASRFMGKADLFVELTLWDIWRVMRFLPSMIGSVPYFQADTGGTPPVPGQRWTNLTIYGALEEVIETFLSFDTGLTFTLAALGTQDDGITSAQIPLKEYGFPVIYPNKGESISGMTSDTYAWLLAELMTWTKSFIRAKAGLGFEIVYPQEADLVNETYYSSLADGHVFYENADRNFVLIPNHVIVYANQLIDENTGDETWTVVGEAYDADEYTSPPTYNGPFLPMRKIERQADITNQTDAANRASALLSKAQAEVFGGRVYIPHDARVELYDRVEIQDTRGV
jgi:hypothetical protein